MAKGTIRIALMGVTGSGKSTFIRTASGREDVGVCHELHSFTSEVQPFEFEYQGYQITLIDTPGFNDTTRSETEVLRSIADYLDFTYRNPPHLRLHGIIYLQSITDPRMYGTSLRNLRMFKDLVGPDPLRNVILATSRWGLASKSGELGKAQSNEEQLRTEETFWAPMIARGSRIARFEDSRESALELVLSPVDQKPLVLQIQSELVDEAKPLIDTTAGHTVSEEIKQLEVKSKAEIVQLKKEMAEEKDNDVQEALKQAQKDFQKKLDRVHEEQDALRYESRNERRRREEEYDQLHRAFEQRLQQKLGAQQLDFDRTVEQLLANEHKLHEEQRIALKQQIAEVKKKEKKDRTGLKLVARLLPIVGSVVLGLIGIPTLGFGC